MPIDETNRLTRIQAAIDAIRADGGTGGAIDAELILFLFKLARANRQALADLKDTVAAQVADLEARVAALENPPA